MGIIAKTGKLTLHLLAAAQAKLTSFVAIGRGTIGMNRVPVTTGYANLLTLVPITASVVVASTALLLLVVFNAAVLLTTLPGQAGFVGATFENAALVLAS
jgi:hypothetical protein